MFQSSYWNISVTGWRALYWTTSLTLLGHWRLDSAIRAPQTMHLNYWWCPFLLLVPLPHNHSVLSTVRICTAMAPLWYWSSTGKKGLWRRNPEERFLLRFAVNHLRHQRKAKGAFWGNFVGISALWHTCLLLSVRWKRSQYLHHSSSSASPISTNDIWTGYCSSSYRVTMCSGTWA